MGRYLPLVTLAAILLGGCGPETLPSADAPSAQRLATAVPVAPPTTVLPAPGASVPLTASLPIVEPSPEMAVTSPTSGTASSVVPSLAITDPARVDIFQIAQELVEIGDAAFQFQVTMGEGEKAVHLLASEPVNLPLPCFPMNLAPVGKQYTCRVGGGLDTDVWIALWGEGLQGLLTDHGAWTSAWTSDGTRTAVATLTGKNDQGDIPVKLIDLTTDQEIVVGLMSAPYTLEIAQRDELIYVYDGNLVIQAIPKDLSEGMSLMKSIPLVDFPDNQTYLNGPTAWFKVSPSGDHVAFLREGYGYETGSLSILDLVDEQETTIDAEVKNHSNAFSGVFEWSPSGDTLAYMTIRTTMDGESGEEAYTHHSELWLVDADGQNRRRLWGADRPNRSYSAIDWLPTGKAIVVSGAVDTWNDLVQIVSVNDGQHRDLMTGGEGIRLFELGPGLAAGLMTSVGAIPSYDLVVFSYPAD